MREVTSTVGFVKLSKGDQMAGRLSWTRRTIAGFLRNVPVLTCADRDAYELPTHAALVRRLEDAGDGAAVLVECLGQDAASVQPGRTPPYRYRVCVLTDREAAQLLRERPELRSAAGFLRQESTTPECPEAPEPDLSDCPF